MLLIVVRYCQIYFLGICKKGEILIDYVDIIRYTFWFNTISFTKGVWFGMLIENMT